MTGFPASSLQNPISLSQRLGKAKISIILAWIVTFKRRADYQNPSRPHGKWSRRNYFFLNEKLQTPQTGLEPIPALHNRKPLIMLTATAVGWWLKRQNTETKVLARHNTRKKCGKLVGKSHILKIGSTGQTSDSECAVLNISKIPQ